MEPDRFRETQASSRVRSAVVPGGIYGHQTPAMLVPGAYRTSSRAARARASGTSTATST